MHNIKLFQKTMRKECQICIKRPLILLSRGLYVHKNLKDKIKNFINKI